MVFCYEVVLFDFFKWYLVLVYLVGFFLRVEGFVFGKGFI